MPAQKVAYSIPDNTTGFHVFVSLSAGIQASTCYHRGSGDGSKSLEKLLSSYLKVAKNAKINTQLQAQFSQ
jgi:hypothetical protein